MIRILLLFLCSTLSLLADTVTGKVVWVDDGDTIEVQTTGRGSRERIRVRLWGIDAPEKGQSYGDESRETLVSLVSGKTITIDVVAIDKYGRRVGRVYHGKTDINREMVKRGMAWWYAFFSADATDLKEAEEQAKSKSLGLWAEDHPVAPWSYRRSNEKSESPKKYRIASSTKRVHNSSCKYYHSEGGTYSDKPGNGPDCKICGGAHRDR